MDFVGLVRTQKNHFAFAYHHRRALDDILYLSLIHIYEFPKVVTLRLVFVFDAEFEVFDGHNVFYDNKIFDVMLEILFHGYMIVEKYAIVNQNTKL